MYIYLKSVLAKKNLLNAAIYRPSEDMIFPNNVFVRAYIDIMNISEQRICSELFPYFLHFFKKLSRLNLH